MFTFCVRIVGVRKRVSFGWKDSYTTLQMLVFPARRGPIMRILRRAASVTASSWGATPAITAQEWQALIDGRARLPPTA